MGFIKQKTMNPTLKAHLISAGQTFVASFGVAIYPMLSTATFQTGLTRTVLLAMLVTGVRAGVKALYEAYVLPWLNQTTVTA